MTENTATTYDVVTFGSGIEHLSPVEVDLRGRIDTMAAALRVYRDESEPADLELLEIDYPGDDADPTERAWEWVQGYALEVKVARWTTEPDGAGEVARVEFLLTFGGPNVRMAVDYFAESPSRVTLERFWGGDRDRAETEDSRALTIVENFVSAFFVVE